MALFPCAKTQHHTAETIDASHRTRWPGFTSQVYRNAHGMLYHVGYHQVVDLERETITRTRAFNEEGAHCIGMNRSSIGTLIIGNYDTCSGEIIPQEKEWLLAKAWDNVKEECPHLTIQDNVPHRTYASKSCYGDSLSDRYIQDVLMRQETAQDNEEKEKEYLHIVSLQKEIIELLQTQVALLIQKISGRRLSLRELKPRPKI